MYSIRKLLEIKTKNMKYLISQVIILLLSFIGRSQIIATVELEEPIEGMCGTTMYALFSGFDAQEQPKCNLSNEELVKLMNEKIEYLKTNTEAKGKGIMGLYINCEGKVIGASSGLKDSDSELSNQIEKFLLEYGQWTPGVYNGKRVDCSESIAIKIKRGVVSLD